MLRFFQNNNPLIVLLFPIIAGVFAFFIPQELVLKINISNQTYFYKQLLLLISGNNFVVFYKILVGLFILFNGLLFNFFVRSVKVSKAKNWYYGFLFSMLIGQCSVFTDNLSVFIALFIFLFALIIIFKTLRKKTAVFDYFNAGMLISTALLFWPNIVFFIPIIFVGLFVLRSQQWREWTTSLVGLFIPIFVFLSFYFFKYSNFDEVFVFFEIISTKEAMLSFSTINIIGGSFFALLLIISTFKTLIIFNTLEKDIQDYYKIFFFMFLFYVVTMFLNIGIMPNALVFAMIAFVIPFSNLLSSIKKRLFAELIFSVFLILSGLAISGTSL